MVIFQAEECPKRHPRFSHLKKIPEDWEAQVAKAKELAEQKAKEQAEMGDFDISVFRWCKKCKGVSAPPHPTRTHRAARWQPPG